MSSMNSLWTIVKYNIKSVKQSYINIMARYIVCVIDIDFN